MLAITSVQSLSVPFGFLPNKGNAANSFGSSFLGRPTEKAKKGAFDFYPLSAPFDESFAASTLFCPLLQI